jgi:hypothetical protein
MIWKTVCQIKLEKNDVGHWLTQEVFVSVEPREEVNREKFVSHGTNGDGKPIRHFPFASYTCYEERVYPLSEYVGWITQMSSHL